MVNFNCVNAEVDLTQIMNIANREKVHVLIKNYKPKKIKYTGLKTKILLADEKSIC